MYYINSKVKISAIFLLSTVLLIGIVSPALGVSETQKLTASDEAALDSFGFSTSISGDIAIVSAIGLNNIAGINSGPVYIFEKISGTWTETAKLIASDAANGDRFGYSISVSGGIIIVGAPLDDDAGSNSGSAYIFEKISGTWTETAKLTASDAAVLDRFGFSTSISGDTVIVGAKDDDDAGSNSGSAYIFEKISGTWTETAKLTAFDAAASDRFGSSTSISGDTVIVGARDDDDAGSNSGSAYIFEKISGTWTETAKLTASDAAAGDIFGFTTSISGDTVIVGAERDDDAGSGSGSAYIFEKISSTWTETAKLIASDAAASDIFGYSTSISGDTVIVGAQRDDDGSTDSGSAYLFEKISGTWTETAKLMASDAEAGDHFGFSTSISGDTVIVGALNSDFIDGTNSGSAYIFTDSDSDGFHEGEDCNDSDDTVFPGAPEIPDDGVDQDCNGTDTVSCYLDLDQDGYGDFSNLILASDGSCDILQSESTTSDDCDDFDNGVNPGATEIPGNGIDEDCDGVDTALPPTLTIIKNTIGSDGLAEFSITNNVSGVDNLSNIIINTSGGTGSFGPIELISGDNYTIEETGVGGFPPPGILVLTSSDCTINGNSVGTDSFEVSDGDVVVCTFVNTYDLGPFNDPIIKITKIVDGPDDTFSFRAFPVASDGEHYEPILFDIITDGGMGMFTIPEGWVFEGDSVHPQEIGLPEDYTLSNTSCTINGVPVVGPIIGPLGFNDFVECTFTNTFTAPALPPTLTIIKNTVGGDDSFTFDVTNHDSPVDSFSLPISTLGGTGSDTVDLEAGIFYTVTEGTLPDGWIATGISCTQNDIGIVNDFTPGPGDSIVCTFTNELPPPPTLRIDKFTNVDGTFFLSLTNDVSTNNGFIVTDTGFGSNSGFEIVAGTTYTLSETSPGVEWSTTIDCVGSTAGPNGGSIFTANNGDSIVCTVTNNFESPPTGADPRTIGFWKNHEDIATPLLPQSLDGFIVGDFATAEDVLKANGKNAHNMLAAQLLATKLNAANGADVSCVSDAISDADGILASAGYSGPDSTTPPKKGDKAAVNVIKDILDDYNNNGCQ